jgi:type II secretory pathway pseudopilin PulG
MFRNRKAQAATELAILGSLIIIAFSFLINYSEQLNREQAYIQQTFRTALKNARKENNTASYTKVVFRRLPNVANSMELGQLQSFDNSSKVLWANGLNEDENGSNIYQLNEDNPISFIPSEPPAEGTTIQSPESFINTVDATTVLEKTEAAGKIVTNKSLQAQDVLQAQVNINGKSYPFTHYLGADGKYYPVATVLNRPKRSMQ